MAVFIVVLALEKLKTMRGSIAEHLKIPRCDLAAIS